MEICSFRLVLEGKIGKEIPEWSRLEFLGKFLADNLALSDTEDNTTGSLNRGGIAGLLLLRTLLPICQKSWEPSFWEVTLFCFSSISFQALLHWLLACLNFTLDSEDLFCWYKWKKWFLWTMTAVQSAENHGDEWDLAWYLQWGIYTDILTRTHSDNLLAAAEAPSLKISSSGVLFEHSRSWASEIEHLEIFSHPQGNQLTQ